MPLANGGGQRALQANLVLVHWVDTPGRYVHFPVATFDRRDVDRFPIDWHARHVEDLLHGGADFGADAVAGDQGDFSRLKTGIQMFF